ncbi:hypothetical protein TB2_041798 [Malus domestica]
MFPEISEVKDNKDDGGDAKNKPLEKSNYEKTKEHPVRMAVLKLNLHCQGCIHKIHRIVTKTKGFTYMSIDKENELLMVKGSMNMKVLAESLKEKLRRKAMAKWTEHVRRVISENGIEGPHEDGHSWRKYGQKDILGAKYPRSYYRCTYLFTQKCRARKKVQRSDEDPTVFEITYEGKHTCSHGGSSVPPPPSPEKQERKRHNHNNTYQQQQSQGNQMSFPTNLRVNTENLDDRENTASPFSFTSSPFGSISVDAFLSSMLDDKSLFASPPEKSLVLIH